MVRKNGSAGPSGDCTNRVLRGGSWKDGPELLRSANRLEVPFGAFHNVGFRVALTLSVDEGSSNDCGECNEPRKSWWPSAEDFTPTFPSGLRRHGAPAGLEAAILADRILEKETEDLIFNIEQRELLIAEIRQVMARIRDAYPGMEVVSAVSRRDPQKLILEFDSGFLESVPGLNGVWEDSTLPRTGHDQLDSLNAALGLRGVKRFIYPEASDVGFFYYSKPINPSAATLAYDEVEVIAEARPMHSLIFGDDVTGVDAWETDGVWHVQFRMGWGDCPSGCMFRREYTFAVKDGSVTWLDGESAEFQRP